MQKMESTNVSSWQVLQRALQEGASQYWALFSLLWPWLLGLWIFSFCSETFFAQFQKVPPGEDMVRLLGQMGLVLTDLAVSVAMLMIVPVRIVDLRKNRQPLTSIHQFTKVHLWPLTLESLRAAAVILLWSLLFILPGLYKMLRLYLLPLVVMFNPRYQKGELDALKHSNSLMKGFFVHFLLLIGCFGLIELGLMLPTFLAPEPFEIFARLVSGALTLIFSVYTFGVLFSVYEALEARRGEN